MLHDMKKFVELNKINGLSNIDNGYFFNVTNNEIYSTKRGELIMLMGSKLNGVLRYNLKMKNYTWSTSVKHSDIMNKVKTDPLVAKTKGACEAKMWDVVEKPSTTDKNGWIIGTFKDSCWSIAEKPKVHETEDAVKKEIERLAKMFPGTTFIKMKVEAFAKSGGVHWF